MGFFTDFCEDQLFVTDEEVDAFDEFLSSYFDQIDRSKKDNNICSDSEYNLRLIARSPESPVACAIARRALEFQERDIKIKAIFANLVSADALSLWIEGDAPLTKGTLTENLRWAKNPSLLDAHEQLILGSSMCWSGDSMRRNTERRYVMDLFENDAPGATRLAYLAFDALWSASVPVSQNQIKCMASSGFFETNLETETETLLTELWPTHFQNTISTRH